MQTVVKILNRGMLIMKNKAIIYFLTILACITLSACGSKNSKQADEQSEASSLQKANSKLKASIQSQKHKKHSNSQHFDFSSSSSIQPTKQKAANINTPNSSSNYGVDNADEAVAPARAKYGDDNGNVHWGYMVDGVTGQPIRNDDGSYFVKGTDGQTMSGTRYSLNVFPDGTITSK